MAIEVDGLGGEVNMLLIQVFCMMLIAGFGRAACHYSACATSEETPFLQAQIFAQAQAREAGQPDAKLFPHDADKAVASKSPWQTGLEELYKGTEGIWLLLSRPYAFMTFWVSYASLMPRTMLDYQNQVLAAATFVDRSEEIIYFGKVNLWINGGAAVLTLLGTRPIIQRLGVGSCLLMLPIGMFLAIAAICLDYTLAMSSVSLVCVMILAYGLNSPCKEMLYVRTSRDIKYKAKSWSEMYGNHMMKFAGAQMNLWVNREHAGCAGHCFSVPLTLLAAGLWSLLWFGLAVRVGQEHRRLEAEDQTIS